MEGPLIVLLVLMGSLLFVGLSLIFEDQVYLPGPKTIDYGPSLDFGLDPKAFHEQLQKGLQQQGLEGKLRQGASHWELESSYRGHRVYWRASLPEGYRSELQILVKPATALPQELQIELRSSREMVHWRGLLKPATMVAFGEPFWSHFNVWEVRQGELLLESQSFYSSLESFVQSTQAGLEAAASLLESLELEGVRRFLVDKEQLDEHLGLALSLFPEEAEVQATITRLLEQEEPDLESRMERFRLLLDRPGPHRAKALAKALEDPSVEIRLMALFTQGEERLPRLRKLVEEEGPLETVPDAEALRYIHGKFAREDVEPLVDRLLAEASGELLREAFELKRKWAQDASDHPQKHLFSLLSARMDPFFEAFEDEALRRFAKDWDWLAQPEAAFLSQELLEGCLQAEGDALASCLLLLGQIQEELSEELLLSVVFRGGKWTQEAARGLKFCGTSKALEALRSLLDREDLQAAQPFVRQAITRIYERLPAGEQGGLSVVGSEEGEGQLSLAQGGGEISLAPKSGD